jgi:plastocyanin domain-containing protein
MLIFFVSNLGTKNTNTAVNTRVNTEVAPVQIVDGKQIIEVNARGGYNPRDITAKAGVPTILRMKTSGTFDCSSAFVIPSLQIQKMLPATGVTDFEIPAQAPGSTMHGTCGMGMYSLQINFQ